MATKGNGKAYRWILSHLNYAEKDWCLIWPFARDKHGRGMLGVNGESWWAHRLMCKLKNGDPPTPKHTAAHSCGNGHEGCINPLHLDWKTQAENLADCREHGTIARHHGGNRRSLVPEQVKAIREARGFQTQCQLATKFGVSEGTISDIWHDRTHVGESKVPYWGPDEVELLRRSVTEGMNFSQIAKLIGRPAHSVSSKAYRMGIASGQPVRKIYDPPKSAEPGSQQTNGERDRG
jgi:hypothetical protein